MDIFLPPLSEAPQATIERWYKAPGDQVAAGEALLVVLTDRFEWDVPSAVAGTIAELLAQPGETIAIGGAIARLKGNAVGGERNGRVNAVATPLARKIAAAHGLDLAAIAGSGRGGRVTGSDVRALLGDTTATAVAEPPAVVAPSDATVDQPPTADHAQPDRVLARAPGVEVDRQPGAIPHAKLRAPHALTAIDVDLGKADVYISRHAARLRRRGIALDHAAIVAAAVVRTLAAHRSLTSVYTDDGLIVRRGIDLRVDRNGAAVTIAHAGDLNAQGLARSLGAGGQRTDRDPTFGIAVGAARWEHALIDGMSAALAIGAVERQPVVIEGNGRDEIAIRPVAILTLAYDARAIMPHEADAFLRDLKHDLEQSDPV